MLQAPASRTGFLSSRLLPRPVPSPVLGPCSSFSLCSDSASFTGWELRRSEVLGVVLSSQKPGRPSQRAPGTFPQAGLPHRALVWGTNGSVDGVRCVYSHPVGIRGGEPPA